MKSENSLGCFFFFNKSEMCRSKTSSIQIDFNEGRPALKLASIRNTKCERVLFTLHIELNINNVLWGAC